MNEPEVEEARAWLQDQGLVRLVVGVGLGVLGDLTLRVLPWGAGAFVTAAAVLVAILVLQRQQGTRSGHRFAPAVVTGLAAAGLVWRDAAVLKVLDVILLGGALALLASERLGQRAPRTLGVYATRILGSALHTAFSAPVAVTTDVEWSRLRLRSVLLALLSVVRGLMLAIPVILIFGSLLASADAVFAARLAQLLDLDMLALLGHLAGTFLGAWIAAGLLRAAVRRLAPAHEPPWTLDEGLVGLVETVLVLGLVDLLFGGFVWIQLRYLFGGSQWVQQIAGLSYADYARRGFFELVTITALVLPLLLVLHWALRPRRRREAATFAALAGLQVVLVLVMLVSAFERMRLYREEYGLTQLRLYTTAFMLWLGALLVWFLVTVLRGRRVAFAQGAMASSVVAIVALHAFDPERRIVETNRALPRAFDAAYAADLSADAVPALVDSVWQLDEAAKRAVARRLLARWAAPETADWRRWSLSREQAQRCVQAAEPALRAVADHAEARAAR
jgi:hypothetical protein